jgi:hypothetical protein
VDYLPGPVLADLARALRVTTDELLGIEPVRDDVASPAPRAHREVADLSPQDQRAVITFIEALLEKRGLKQAS